MGRISMPEPELVEYENGGKEWFLNGDDLHREDGPAVELPDGYKAWYINNRLHRLDGPALEWPDGRTFWFLNGQQATEEEFLTATQPNLEIER